MIRILAPLLLLAWAGTGLAGSDDWQKLLTPQQLAALSGTTELRILDIRPTADKGPAYSSGHIPNAVSAPYDTWRGPKENPGRLPTDAALTERLRSAGVEVGTPVVVVHQGDTQSDFGAAARVYWTLKSAGVERIAILNGGFKAWQAAGLSVTAAPLVPARSAIAATLSDTWLASVDAVAAASRGEGGAVLVDARPEAFFRGQKKHDAAPAAGTIAGAVSFVHERWFAPEQTAISAPEAAIARARALAEEAGDAAVISFCNTGHWAATNWFALSEIAGIETAKLYPESVVGWQREGRAVVPGQ